MANYHEVCRGERLLVTPKEARRLLSVSHTLLYELLSRGELEACHIGRSRRITMQSIKTYVERQLAAAEPRREQLHHGAPAN